MAERSVDEQVGSVTDLDGTAQAILGYMLKSAQGAGDKTRVDELIEERYKPENYEKTVIEVARRKSAAEHVANELSSLHEYPIAVGAWAQGRAQLKSPISSDPSVHIAKLLQLGELQDVPARDDAVYKELGFATSDFAARQKTLQISMPETGGILTRGTQVDSFFKPLRNQSIVMRFRPTIRQIVDGAITVTGLETDVAATWGKEVNVAEVDSQPTWGDRDETSKHLMVLVPIGESALRSSAGPTIMRDVNDSLQYAMRHEVDTNFINAAGGQHRPTGLRHLAGNTVASGGDTLPDIIDDVYGLHSRMALNNVPMRQPGMLLSMRDLVKLKFIRDTTSHGRFIFKDELANGTWFGAQIEGTNEIAITEGAGTESFLLYVDFSGVLIGIGDTLEVRTWGEGSYTVNGETRNPIERRERVITAHTEVLQTVAQREHIEELDEVTWGAA